jgi:hypothetical protein
MRSSRLASIWDSSPWIWVSTALSSVICSCRRASAAAAACSRVVMPSSRSSSSSRRLQAAQDEDFLRGEAHLLGSRVQRGEHCSGVGGAQRLRRAERPLLLERRLLRQLRPSAGGDSDGAAGGRFDRLG